MQETEEKTTAVFYRAVSSTMAGVFSPSTSTNLCAADPQVQVAVGPHAPGWPSRGPSGNTGGMRHSRRPGPVGGGTGRRAAVGRDLGDFGALNAPSDLFVRGREVFVLDNGNNRVMVFDETLAPLREIPVSHEAGLEDARGLFVVVAVVQHKTFPPAHKQIGRRIQRPKITAWSRRRAGRWKRPSPSRFPT